MRADGRPDSEFMLAAGATRQLENGDVGTTNKQEESDGREEQIKRAAQLFLKIFIESHDVKFETIFWKMLGCVFGELVEQRLKPVSYTHLRSDYHRR